MVEEIAMLLGETEPGPLDSITRIIETLGEKQTRQLVKEAIRIHADEGIKTHDGTRNRTLGGVFFFLVAGFVDVEQYKQIWPERKIPWFVWQKSEQAPKKSGPPPWGYGDLYGMGKALARVAGGMKMEMKLVGKHGKVIKRKDLVITAVSNQVRRDQVPTGLPKPPLDPTVYVCYIPLQKWEELPHPCDNIEISGHAGLDLENMANDVIVVWATDVKAAAEEAEAA
ncbi:MAG: phosphorylated adapter RNA export RNA-binding domain-containing protein [Chloroflexota bacterium]